LLQPVLINGVDIGLRTSLHSNCPY